MGLMFQTPEGMAYVGDQKDIVIILSVEDCKPVLSHVYVKGYVSPVNCIEEARDLVSRFVGEDDA